MQSGHTSDLATAPGLFLRVFSQILINICKRRGQISLEIGFLICQVSKFQTDFRCSPEKYFWKSGHPVRVMQDK